MNQTYVLNNQFNEYPTMTFQQELVPNFVSDNGVQLPYNYLDMNYSFNNSNQFLNDSYNPQPQFVNDSYNYQMSTYRNDNQVVYDRTHLLPPCLDMNQFDYPSLSINTSPYHYNQPYPNESNTYTTNIAQLNVNQFSSFQPSSGLATPQQQVCFNPAIYSDNTETSPSENLIRKKKTPRGPNWKSEESAIFLKLIMRDDFLPRFQTIRQNPHIWKTLAKEMANLGYPKTAKSCTNHWKVLMTKYKKCKESGRTAHSQAENILFEKIQTIIAPNYIDNERTVCRKFNSKKGGR